MKLFDDMNRSDNRPARYVQSNFDYLNTSARPEFKRIRNLLDEWFEHIPREARFEIRSRFRENDDRQHASAFLELYLHELLFRLEFDIDFHPPVDGEKTHPDFLALRRKKRLFYLEATLAASSDTEAANKARKNQVYDTLNRMKSPNFFIGLEVRGAPGTPPPGRRIRNFLERQIAGLDPDKVMEQYRCGGVQALPSWNWEHEGWRVDFFPIPKSTSARAKPGVRPLGLQISELSWHSPHIGIRNSLRGKATKYGQLDLPYVVAINILDELGVDDCDISNALFGNEQVTVLLRGNDLAQPVSGRKPNGFWHGPEGLQNRRVSTVLVMVNLYPWNIAKVTPIVWHNPWASHTMPRYIWPLSQRVPDFENNQLVKLDGRKGGELLGLRPDWPKSRRAA